MDIRVLRYFLMIAREQNITNAAKALHLTQPTLSRQMMDLEKELGTTLFNRSRHQITLTEDGLLLRRRAQELVELFDKTRQEFTQDAEKLSGGIMIGSGEFHVNETFARLLGRFRDRYPDVRFHVYSNTSDAIMTQLDQGLLDFGILMEPIEVRKYQYVRFAEVEQWGILVRKDHDLAQKAAISALDLLGEKIMIPQRDVIHSVLNNWFGDHAERLDIIGGSTLPYHSAMMVRAGMGVAITLSLECRYDDLVFRPLSPSIEQRTALVWKKSQAASSLIREFIRFCKECPEGMMGH